MKRAIILYDLLAREYWSCNEIKKEFERRGSEAEVFSLNFEFYKAIAYAKKRTIDYLIIPSCYIEGTFQRIVLPFKKYNTKLLTVCMHVEQIGYEGREADMLPQSDSGKNTMLHLSWGRYFTDLLLSVGIKSELILEAGHLRMQQYFSLKKENLSRDSIAEIYGLEKDKKWVLYCDSGLFMFYEQQQRGENRNIDESQQIGLETTRKLRHTFAESFVRTVEILNGLSDEIHDSYEIIFRPHPGIAGMKTNCLDSRIKIIRDFSVYTWFRYIEYNIVFFSTSIFESEMAGVKSFRLEPTSPPFEVAGVKDYPVVRTKAELEEILIGSANVNLRETVYNKYIGKCDEKMVSNFVESICKFDKIKILEDVVDKPNNRKIYTSRIADTMVRLFKAINCLDKVNKPEAFRFNKYEHPIFKSKYL